MELEQLAAQASQVMKEAGAVIRAIPRPKVYTKEGHANFVTEGDVASQNYLMEHLSPLLPEAHFFAEEQEENQLAPGYNWVIDPIDGTTNFIRGYQSWCISVGLVLDGEGLLGLVLNLASGDLYSGIRGKGAFRNGEPIHVADVPPENALVVFGTSPYYPELADTTFAMALDLCHLAAGCCDGFFELRLSPWDYAAGSVILREAGGLIGTAPGKGFRYDEKQPILAGTPQVYPLLVQGIRRYG